VTRNVLVYDKWSDHHAFPNIDIFDSDGSIHYIESKQGGTGTCALMNAVSGIAEWPALVKDLFVTDTKNNAGIIGVKLYIRGKPWVVSLDERMWFATTRTPNWLLFARESTDDKAIWGAVLEKAWAKIRGNYA
jgi:hypothetical protein